MNADDLQIQWLDRSGWVTNNLITDGARMNGQMITMAMEQAQRLFPGKRIRAVDGNDRVVDIYS